MCRERNGHTLVEMVVVVAVLVAVAAISFPTIKPMLDHRHKDAAADVVRARWSQLRSKAINTNRPYSFECKPGTTKFRLVPEHTGEDDDAEMGAIAAELDLPGEIKFDATGGQGGGGDSGGWTKIATFLPDGTTKSEFKNEVTLTNGTQVVTLKLNSATGAVSSSEGSRK